MPTSQFARYGFRILLIWCILRRPSLPALVIKPMQGPWYDGSRFGSLCLSWVMTVGQLVFWACIGTPIGLGLMVQLHRRMSSAALPRVDWMGLVKLERDWLFPVCAFNRHCRSNFRRNFYWNCNWNFVKFIARFMRSVRWAYRKAIIQDLIS